MSKAKLSQMKEQLDGSKKPPKKKIKKEPSSKREVTSTSPSQVHVPRGERADFLKITLTIPGDLLTELRALGMRRKANKQKDTDTSALIREAVVDFLNKHAAT